MENPLDEFLLEAQTLTVPRVNASSLSAADGKRSSIGARGAAAIHELPLPLESRFFSHVSREAADTRRRLTELTHTLETAIANESDGLQRLTWMIKLVIYVLLAISMAQFGLIVWTRSR